MAFQRVRSIFREPFRSGLLLALSVCLPVWLLSTLGAFRALDGLVYDPLLRFETGLHTTPPRVLIVEVDDDSLLRSEDTWLDLLSTLEGLGTEVIVFNRLPDPELERVYEAAASARAKIVFGRRLVHDPEAASRLRLADLPVAAQRYGVATGIVHPPPSVGGVSRSQRWYVQLNDQRVPTLEARAAEYVQGSVEPAGEEFLIAFRGGPASLPNVTLSRVLKEDLTPQLADGKCVLVGVHPRSPQAGLITPTTTGLETMSLLEYEGQALNSLLSGRLPYSPSVWIRFLALLIPALAAALSYRRLDVRPATWIALTLLILYVLTSSALFVAGRIWLPLTEPLLAHSVLFIVSLRHRALMLNRAMKRLIIESSVQLRDKYWPIHFYSSTPSWSLVVNMINQTLDLNKLLFLEVDPEKKRLKELHALGCSLDDIVERRRDYSRPPYTDAVKAKGPIPVDEFLRTSNDREKQYLVPLLFAGELLGFWAIGIDGSKTGAIPHFQAILADYTARISELLHHLRAESPHAPTKRVLVHSVKRDITEATYYTLASTLGLLEHRLSTLEKLLNRIDSGIIIYDVFGRILQINQQMLALLNKENLSPFEMTALDLVLALSDYELTKSRRLLRHVILENNSVSFPVTLRSMPDNRYLVHLKPLIEESSSESAAAANRRIGARTILCELVETTSLTRLYELKTRLTDRLGVKLRSDLASVDLSSALLSDGDLESGQRRLLSKVIHGKVRSTVQALSECQQFLSFNTDIDDLERFPIDPRPPLETALDKTRQLARERGVKLETLKPHFVSYVFASSEKLASLFQAMLRLLCNDATDNSTVVVKLTENADLVTFDFSNTGFGIPDELLQEYVFGTQPMSSEDLEVIQAGARWVQAWGGFLDAESGVGVGLHFTVRLVKFI